MADAKTVEQAVDKVDACLDEAQCSAERYDEAMYKLALEAKESFDFVLAERRLLLRSLEQINAAFALMLLNEHCGGDGWWKGWQMLKKAHGYDK